LRDVFKISVFILPVNWPDLAEAISLPSWDNVHVQMEDGLFGNRTGGRDQIHPLRIQGRVDRAAHPDHGAHEVRA
jgi:hypothetical protein